MIFNENIMHLREELNEIDEKLGKLLIRRFEIAKEIGRHKKENGFPIEDLQREREIIDNRIDKFNLPDCFVEELFLLIFKHSKKVQNGD